MQVCRLVLRMFRPLIQREQMGKQDLNPGSRRHVYCSLQQAMLLCLKLFEICLLAILIQDRANFPEWPCTESERVLDRTQKRIQEHSRVRVERTVYLLEKR